MTPFISVRGLAAALPGANIDTDVIMPKIFLKGIDRKGLALGLFHDLRFDGKGRPRPEFVLNRPDAPGACILVAGPNFGCGSSREHAVWGLQQYGIRAVVGTSFGGIFADNAANNGLLLISLDTATLAPIMTAVTAEPRQLTIDLADQFIDHVAGRVRFQIEPERRRMLMSGLDRIGDTLARSAEIRRFEAAYFASQPWLGGPE
jgi:3-isopropylmalate/(R)-2-methylmalate dehydratase small subunit